MVVFLFNDFLLIVKPKLFLRKAATPADLEPFGKNEFIVYRHVSKSQNHYSRYTFLASVSSTTNAAIST